MVEHISNSWSDAAVGACLLVIALALLIFCLVTMVKVLNSVLHGAVADVIQKVLNSDFPKPFGFLTGYVAITVGIGMTMILQSSSIFTSALTPLVGAGVLSLDRMYPLTLGSNIGTTFTAVLAALSSSRDIFQVTMQVALCHMFFNVVGILIWYPVPQMRRLPMRLAKHLGNITARHRWFAVVYIAAMFFLAPAAIFALSLVGWPVLLGVVGPLVALVSVVAVVDVLQRRRPGWLPGWLRTWDFLPVWLRSLDPYDDCAARLGKVVCRRRRKRETVEYCMEGRPSSNGVEGGAVVARDPPPETDPTQEKAQYNDATNDRAAQKSTEGNPETGPSVVLTVPGAVAVTSSHSSGANGETHGQRQRNGQPCHPSRQ